MSCCSQPPHRCPALLPPLAGFVLAFFCSMVGVSGAFLLMPFQMSVLGYVAPSVSATNLVFNLVAIPSGVWRYAREGRMDWPLARIIALGTLPGLLAGWWLRLHWLADPRTFKLFVGGVLAGLAVHLYHELFFHAAKPATASPSASNRALFSIALGIGVIGGAYGIGGMAGMYLGARTQKHVSQRMLKIGLAVVLTGFASGYILQYFR